MPTWMLAKKSWKFSWTMSAQFMDHLGISNLIFSNKTLTWILFIWSYFLKMLLYSVSFFYREFRKTQISRKNSNLLDLGSGGLRCLALSTSTLICSRSSCTRMLTLPKGNSCMAFCSRCLSHKYLPTRTLLSEAYNCNWASILSKVSSFGDLPA